MSCTCAVRTDKPVVQVRPFVVEVMEHGNMEGDPKSYYLVFAESVRRAWPKLQAMNVCEHGSIMRRVWAARQVGPICSGSYDLTPPEIAA